MGKSCQKGWVSIRGEKWYGYFRRDRFRCRRPNQPKTVSIPVALGLKSEMTKTQAQQKLEERDCQTYRADHRRRNREKREL